MTNFLETNRLILKLPELSDFEHIMKLRKDPEVMKYIGDGTPHTKEQVQHFFNIAIPYQEKHGFGFYSVFEKESGEFVGQAGIFHKGLYDEQPDIELAYRLHKKYWRKGYATELANALIYYAFLNLKLKKIVAAAEPENIGSQKVLLKSGFHFLGKQKWWNGAEIFYYEIYNTKFVQEFLIKTKHQKRQGDEVRVVPYNKQWPSLFEIEANRIKEALGDNCITIHHIGSTAVPGLSAKPIIDMIPVVKNIRQVDNAIHAMKKIGYESRGEYGMLFRHFFIKKEPNQNFNIHVYEENTPDIERHIKFRDWMRAHTEVKEVYQKIKSELATKFPNDIWQYVSGKDKFIESIDEQTGFDGLRLVHALKEQEWDAVRIFRQKYFLDRHASDLYTWTFNHINHAHIILYKATKIIGYAHIQFLHENRAALRIFIVDEAYRHQETEDQFLKLCKKWVNDQDIFELNNEFY